MLLLIFCLGGILGSFLTLIVVLYWQSLVERIWLPPEKRHEPAKLIELDVLDADNPKIWLGCLFQFLFAELKDTEKVQKWFREKLVIEVEELKEKLPSRFVKDIKLNKFGLGTQPPIISNVKLSGWKTNQSKDIVEEVAVRCDVRYAGEFYVSLDVSLPIGQDAFVFIRLRQLVGNIEIKFSRQPFTHWSISFTEEPQTVIDAVTQVHGRAVPQLANIIVAKLKRTIRRRHCLPNFKIRFPPFFPRPMRRHPQPDPSSATPVLDSNKNKTIDLQQSNQPFALNVYVAAFSRLPQSVEPSALLFFTLTCDSVPLTKQFSRLESFSVVISDPNEAIGVLHIPSILSVDGIDLASRKFTVFQGYYISAIVAESPAQRAGIKPGGVLVSVDGVNIASSNPSLENIFRKAIQNSKNGTLRLDICNVDSPLCQLMPFCEAMSPVKETLSGSTNSIDKSLNDSNNLGSIDSADSASILSFSPDATLRSRHRKNLSNCSVTGTPELNHKSMNVSRTPPQSLLLDEVSSQHITRSSSDTNISSQQLQQDGETKQGTLFSSPSASKAFSTMPKDLNFLAERPFQQAATLPPPVDDCIVIRYNGNVLVEDPQESQDQQEVVVGDVCWTKCRPYPASNGVSATLNETLTFNLPFVTSGVDENAQKNQSAFLNVVAWIGIPESSHHVESGGQFKWNRLHAISYATFDLATVIEEISNSGKMSGCYVRRTANFCPFASIAPIITGDGVIPGESGNGSGKVQPPPLSAQRGFAPELCFGDISLGFAVANGGQRYVPQDKAPFTIYRQVDGGTLRPQDQQGGNTLRSNATLKGMTEKLKMERETCEHELVVAVSSRSQPCTVCSKSLGILQRLSKSHAPLTCLRCGLLCHPRCAPKLLKNKNKSPSPPPPKSPPSESDSTDSFQPLPNTLRASSESLPLSSSPAPSSNGVMSKWTSRAKKIVAAAREKEQKLVAKAGPRLTQKWRDLRNRSRPIHGVASSTSLQSFPLEADDSVEVGEDVDSLLTFSATNDNPSDTVVAEELIRAWAAKAAESPGAALEGSLAEALLSNGESDALLFQLKNLGKELFADLDSEERRLRLDSVISRLTEQLDEESERHAELKTQLKVATASNSSLMKKFKQSDNNSPQSGVAASCEAQLNRCDQRIRSLCLLIVHYSAGLDDCVSSAIRSSSLLQMLEQQKEDDLPSPEPQTTGETIPVATDSKTELTFDLENDNNSFLQAKQEEFSG